MRSLSQEVSELGLFVKCAHLLQRGWSREDLRAGLTCGAIIRVRKGWYSLPSAPLEAINAFRIGGRLTGLSALRTYGIWTPTTKKLHLTVPTDARGLRLPTDMRARFARGEAPRCRVSWTDDVATRQNPYVWRVSVIDALVHILNTHDRVTSIVCLDAALHNRREQGHGILQSNLDHIFRLAPSRAQAWRADVDGRAGSGGETEFRLASVAAGIPFVPQSAVAGVGHLDGQVGPSTFVEVDGAEWHDNWPAFKADCERDAKVAAKGGRVLRFSYDLFRDQWELCERALRSALEDDYRRPPSTEFPNFPWRMTRPRRHHPFDGDSSRFSRSSP